jgi:hypothetical protein
VSEGKNFIAQTSWSTEECGQNLKIIAQSREEAFSKIYESISIFIEGFGRQYISSWSYNNEVVSCPQAYLELPIDLWCCKNNKVACPLQAQINILNREQFFQSCLLSEKKSDIWNAIIKGKYTGFHHIPGRSKCGTCKSSKTYSNYHYPWELTFLSDCCDIKSVWSDIERRKNYLFLTNYLVLQ